MRNVLPLLLTVGLAWAQPIPENLPARDRQRLEEFRARGSDWRNGTLIYQVFVDRFAPSLHLSSKSALYGSPRRLRSWEELPQAGPFDEAAACWSHELDFWGGDLESLQGKLDYLEQLGIEVVYLNPIFEALTNHKYDANDYHKVDPVYGNRAQLGHLAEALHQRQMRLMLDGVFNHMGKSSPLLQQRPQFFRRNAQGQTIGWWDVENLPELLLENPEVRDYLYAGPDSVVQSYLREEKIDGWRLDVAFDLGFDYLSQITEAAHSARPGSAVIGEIWNYPADWHPAVDGVMNMHGRALLLAFLQGKLAGPQLGSMWETMVTESGYEHILKAWLVLDNHDTPRLNHLLPEDWQVRMARALQFSLTGSVVLYYGSEVDMGGGEDPANRAPMQWQRVEQGHPSLDWHRRLIALRKQEPALRWGDYKRLHSQRLLAFVRTTLSPRDTVIVLANPSAEPVSEFLQLRDSKLHDVTRLEDLLGSDLSGKVLSGCLEVTLQPHQVVWLKPDTRPYPKGYDRYDRSP